MSAKPNKWAAAMPVPTEHQDQCVVVQWCELHEHKWPELWMLYAVPNAGAGSQKGQAGKMKAEGAKKGMTDLVLPVPRGNYHGLYLEMKRIKGGDLKDPDQLRWQEGLYGQGYRVRVCKGADVAIKEIERYMMLGGFQVLDVTA